MKEILLWTLLLGHMAANIFFVSWVLWRNKQLTEVYVDFVMRTMQEEQS